MKKLILPILSMLLAHSIFSQPVPPVRVAECYSICEVPVIDGIDNEGHWSEDQELTIFSLSAPEDWSGEADFIITFKMAWGYLYFYTFVRVNDDIEHSWNGIDGNPWEFDNIEWFFQLDTQTVPTTYSDNTVQIRFNRGEAGFQSSTFREGITEEDFLWHSENTAEGWVLECAIPWTNVMPNGSRQEDIYDWIENRTVIGFDLSGADSDGTDPMVGARANGTQTAWDEDGDEGDTADGTEDNAWNNTSVFGFLELVLQCTGSTNKLDTDIKSKCFPNPVATKLNFSEPFNYTSIKIYSSSGKLILDQELTNSSIDVSSLIPGLYIAVFDNTDTFKFIKE